MKKRLGFVSNSSSSSFTCDVCGETTSGWDMGLADAQMMTCAKGHTFCDCHSKKDINNFSYEEKREYLLKNLDQKYHADDILKLKEEAIDEEFIDEIWEEQDNRYKCGPLFCPICTFSNLEDNEALRYLLLKRGITITSLLEEIKATYKNHDKFMEAIKDIKLV